MTSISDTSVKVGLNFPVGGADKILDMNHIHAIENFWNQAKRVLRRYNGIYKKSFPLLLKECEFRFNYGTPANQLKILKKWCQI